MNLKIGMAQLLVEGGEPLRNLQRAEKLIRRAANEQCSLVILPETLDFAWTHPSALNEAEPIPGTYSDYLSSLAKELSIWICAGLTEKTPNGNFNAAILINHHGQIVLKYHKINLLEVEFPYYRVGKHLQVAETPFGNIGVNICADNYTSSELHNAHLLARMGAQLILSPSSWTVEHSITEEQDPYAEKWIYPLQKIANRYQIPVVSVTSVGYIVGGPYEGKKMVGCSLAVDHTGILAQGEFNEFAGDLKVVDVTLRPISKQGTQW